MEKFVQLHQFVESLMKFGIREIVNKPIDWRVQMTERCKKQMGLIGKCIVPIDHNNQSVRNPAARKNQINKEKRAREFDRLQVVIGARDFRYFLGALAHGNVYFDIENSSDGHWYPH